LALADLIVDRLLPAGAALTIAVDDTLFKRSGEEGIRGGPADDRITTTVVPRSFDARVSV
jgi:hypothetical protein